MDGGPRWVSRHLGRRAVSDAISVRMFPGDGIAQERCHLGSNYRARCGRAIRLPMAICESAMCNSCHPAAICGSATCASSSSQIAAARRSSRHSRRQQCSISVGGRSWSELPSDFFICSLHFAFPHTSTEPLVLSICIVFFLAPSGALYIIKHHCTSNPRHTVAITTSPDVLVCAPVYLCLCLCFSARVSFVCVSVLCVGRQV